MFGAIAAQWESRGKFYLRIAFLPIYLRRKRASIFNDMQISYQYQGKWHIKKLSADVVTVGRPNNREGIHIDLSPDTTVSRLHARVWLENEVCWLEDLGSRYGTKVNGAQITGRVQLQAGDTVEIGETALRVDPAPEG